METILLKFSLLCNIAFRNDTRSVLSTTDRNSSFFKFYYYVFLFRIDCSFSWLCPEKDNWVVVVNTVTLKMMSLWTIQPLTRCCCWLTEFPLGKLITQVLHLEATLLMHKGPLKALSTHTWVLAFSKRFGLSSTQKMILRSLKMTLF